MKFTIEIDDEKLAEACKREFLDSLQSRHNGHIASVIRTAIGEQVTSQVVRPIVDEAIKAGVRQFADEHLQDLLGRMVRKIVSEKKAEIAKELEST
jgi:hypothetical protein